MKAVTESEMGEILSRCPELQVDGKEVRFRDAEAQSISINLRLPEPHQLEFLARLVASLIHEERDFRSAYLWVTQWGVWNPNVEGVGFNALERYRQGFGENRSLNVAPGHLFRQDEFLSSVACLLQPMVIGWDAYYIPQFVAGTLDYLVLVSHDSLLDIVVRTEGTRRKVEEALTKFTWLNLDRKRVARAD
jgi:hypothetical protein